jgi:hypothetical protein
VVGELSRGRALIGAWRGEGHARSSGRRGEGTGVNGVWGQDLDAFDGIGQSRVAPIVGSHHTLVLAKHPEARTDRSERVWIHRLFRLFARVCRSGHVSASCFDFLSRSVHANNGACFGFDCASHFKPRSTPSTRPLRKSIRQLTRIPGDRRRPGCERAGGPQWLPPRTPPFRRAVTARRGG